MEYSDNFSNYVGREKDLLGRKVLYESGQSYGYSISKRICQIAKITSTGFRLFDRIGEIDKPLFSFDGQQKGLNSRSDIGTISKCTLLTTEEVARLKSIWKEKQEKLILVERVKTFFTQKESLSLSKESLESILNLCTLNKE